jgi:ABC-2 type transport system ATP-binding protein
MGPVVEVRDLVKRYGEVVAVAGISLEVHAGEVFGLLGPNGAGKTTTLEILEGLRRPDGGTIRVAGVDVRRDPQAVKARIGVQLQQAGFFPRLTVGETVRLFASFHRRSVAADVILQRLGLAERSRTLVEDLSGGLRQRLSLALALVNDPEVVFLDEPTTGLDPQARRHVWEIIEGLRGEGRTVVLTTHFMEEAQRLCDRVAVLDHGRILAQGTPHELIQAYGGSSTLVIGGELQDELVRELPGVQAAVRRNGETWVHTLLPLETLHALVETRTGRIACGYLHLHQPTLEDVFLTLTGRRLRE